MENIKWHIGCSGFHYREWKEFFYPKGLPQAKWFSYYAERFNTLEINNTFYRFPGIKLFQNWYDKSPEGFVFSVKVPGSITHYKQFRETQQLVTDFYKVSGEGLREKLGCILFQLPPRLEFNMEKLDAMISQMDLSFNNVIEFRHKSWWNPMVLHRLKENNITFCGVSFPGLDESPVHHLPVAYYRFHGVPKLYYSHYETDFISNIISRIKSGSAGNVFIYFNNTATAAALENANFVQQLIKYPTET